MENICAFTRLRTDIMVSTRKNKYDRNLLVMTMILMGSGLIMVISSFTDDFINNGPLAFILDIGKVILYLIIGFLAMVTIQKRFNLKKIIHFTGYLTSPAMVVIIVLMFATLFFTGEKGAQAWIRFPLGFTFQPVEFLKIGSAVVFANHYATNLNNEKSLWEVIKMPLIYTLLVLAFITEAQNDLGNGLIFVMISYAIFLCVPDRRFILIKRLSVVLLLVGIIIFYILGPVFAEMIYSLPETARFKVQLMRMATIFDPMRDLYKSGYQILNSLVAFSNGGIFGVGLGNSTTKMVVPEVSNDAIIAVIAEETGLIGVLFLLVLYFLIVSRIINFATIKNMDNRARLILIGIASYFVAQLFVNIGGMIGMIPMTGVTLLFVSSGGTSILAAFISIGIVQAIVKEYIR